jgi:hypothetical protein
MSDLFEDRPCEEELSVFFFEDNVVAVFELEVLPYLNGKRDLPLARYLAFSEDQASLLPYYQKVRQANIFVDISHRPSKIAHIIAHSR